jgi:CheY-like chemotaxis protein
VILLAEDNEDSITTFRDYLLDRGYRVIVGRNGGQAVTMARKERPDLILMDIQMPGMDGLEAMHHIREDPDPGVSNVPIVALTALAMPGDRERCLEMGASEYLSKPVGLKRLVDVIESQLAIAGP